MTDEPFNPFASEDVSPPFAPHWEARRRLAQAIRNLTELVVTTDPAIEEMEAVAAELEQQAEAERREAEALGVVAGDLVGVEDLLVEADVCGAASPELLGPQPAEPRRGLVCLLAQRS